MPLLAVLAAVATGRSACAKHDRRDFWYRDIAIPNWGTLQANLMAEIEVVTTKYDALTLAKQLYELLVQDRSLPSVISIRVSPMNVADDFQTARPDAVSSGIRVRLNAEAAGLYVQGALFSSTPLVMGEMGYAMRPVTNLVGPAVVLKLGGWYDGSLQLAGPGAGKNQVLGDREVYSVVNADAGRFLSGFVRIAGKPTDDPATLALYADAGLSCQSPLPCSFDRGTPMLLARSVMPVLNHDIVLAFPDLVLALPDLHHLFGPGGLVLNADGSMRGDNLEVAWHVH